MRWVLWLLPLAVLSGCAAYRWTSDVPEEVRFVAVPVFRNEGDVTGIGAVMATQVLREFQREGTMRVSSVADCALEVQGTVKRTHLRTVAHDRVTGLRNRGYRATATVEVTLVDHRAGRVVFSRKPYRVETTLVGNDDELTGSRDASGRLAEELARRVVGDVLEAARQKKGEKK